MPKISVSQDELVFQKLVDWIARLENQTVELHEHRLVFERVKKIVQGNAKLHGNVFFENMNLWYSTSMAIAVRRLADLDPQSMSYIRFLQLIKKNPRAISRDRVNLAWNKHPLANKEFDRLAGPGSQFLPDDFVDADIQTLSADTKPIRDFADKYVAHNDSGKLPSLPQFSDLTVALKSIEKVHNKYAALLTGYTTAVEPAILYNWQEIFTFPWIDHAAR